MWLPWLHVSDEKLEKYCLGMTKDAAETASIETHLLACLHYVERAEEKHHRFDFMCAL